jgi:hypothetical protein
MESQTLFQFRREKYVLERASRISKKTQSKSTREGVVLKSDRFYIIIDELSKKHPLIWLLN